MNERTLRGCEAMRLDGGPVGFYLQHGFTGCPMSMRPLAEFLADHGVSVVAPRLPGHGTSWEDLAATSWQDWEDEAERAMLDLAGRCSTVVAVGLSMGGAMVLHLAAKHPDRVAGVATVNGYVRDPRLRFAFVLRAFMRSRKGVGNDVKKPGQDEAAYDRIPIAALTQLDRLLRTAERELPAVRQPLLVFSSPEDHTVKPENSRLIVERAGSASKELITLANSYHVATLDYDAELIFERVLAFGRSLAGERAEGTA